MVRRRRRVHRRGRPLSNEVRTCGREGVARARRALDPPAQDQLELDLPGRQVTTVPEIDEEIG